MATRYRYRWRDDRYEVVDGDNGDTVVKTFPYHSELGRGTAAGAAQCLARDLNAGRVADWGWRK